MAGSLGREVTDRLLWEGSKPLWVHEAFYILSEAVVPKLHIKSHLGNVTNYWPSGSTWSTESQPLEVGPAHKEIFASVPGYCNGEPRFQKFTRVERNVLIGWWSLKLVIFLYIRRLKSAEATRGQTEPMKEEEMESRRMAEALGWEVVTEAACGAALRTGEMRAGAGLQSGGGGAGHSHGHTCHLSSSVYHSWEQVGEPARGEWGRGIWINWGKRVTSAAKSIAPAFHLWPPQPLSYFSMLCSFHLRSSFSSPTQMPLDITSCMKPFLISSSTVNC